MRTTNSEVIGRVRTRLKAVKQDAFLTDRFLYGVIMKHAKFLIKREDEKNKLMKFNSVFQTLDFVELEEVDKVAFGFGIASGISIKRTALKLPSFAQGYWGPLIRDVTSIDGSEECQPTNPGTYLMLSRSKNFKYNKNKYYWFLNDHLYFPNLDWDAVRIEGIFEDDISAFTNGDKCQQRQDLYFNVPDYLLKDMELEVMKDLSIMFQLPSDDTQDKTSPLRP
jgi:hypothetical protein